MEGNGDQNVHVHESESEHVSKAAITPVHGFHSGVVLIYIYNRI